MRSTDYPCLAYPQHPSSGLTDLFSTCYTSTLLNRWESYVFTSAKFAEISKFLVYYRPQSVPKYFRCLDLYNWRSLTWKSVLGSLVGVCIACNFCSFLANKKLIWHVVHKICKRIGAASYCTICTVGGAAGGRNLYPKKLPDPTYVRPQCMSFRSPSSEIRRRKEERRKNPS